MKKHRVITILLCLTLLVSGCATWWNKTNQNTNKVLNAQQGVQDAKDALNDNAKDKTKQVQSTASGVDYALSKVTNPPPAVTVAKELNDRTVSIVGVPSVDEMAKMKQLVDNLTSTVAEEQKHGKKMLEDKDKEISEIQKQRDQLKKDLEEKHDELQKVSETVAKTADEYKVTVDKVNSFFGLGGILYGVKKFVTSCLIFLLIFSIAFLILRLLANTNPIAKGAFMVFDVIGSMILHSVKALMPNSFSMAKFVDTSHMETYKNTLSKIVDTIQELRAHGDINSDKKYTLDELLNELSKNMNDDDKKVVDNLKRELRWK